MEIKKNEAKESFVSDLRDAPFNKIEPDRDITFEDAMNILDRYRRHEEFPRDLGKMEFSESREPIFVTTSEKGEKTCEPVEYKETQESDAPERKGGAIR